MDPLVLLPQHVRSLVLSNGCVPLTLPQTINEEFALVAIVDISGYSKLSSKLEEALGTDSGGRIKEIINPPMECITQYVHKYGGSIVKLAGDAVIASWTIDSDCALPLDIHQKVLCLNVFLCCLELLEVFHKYEVRVNLATEQQSAGPQFFEQSLKIHIGLGLGSIDHIHVGGKSNRSMKIPGNRRRASSIPINPSFSRREYFIAGEALGKAGVNLNLGDQGDFVFGQSFHKTLQETIGISCALKQEETFYISDSDPSLEKFQLKAFKFITPIQRNFDMECKEQILPPLLTRSPLYIAHAKAYMDGSVSKLLSADHGGVIGDQLRSVSCVFIKFGGFQSETVAKPENLKQLQACAQLIVSKVQEYEGCVRQFNCDDKSLTALLVWGLDGFGHEKGESFVALQAASEIAKNMKNCLTDPEGFSIGVTTGVVFAGIVGSKERCDNTILGVVVNNAARLMCLPMCHGTVLCDEETYLKTAPMFDFITDIPEVILKGVPHPVKIYNPMGNSTAQKVHLDHLAVSGREVEMETLEESLRIWRSPVYESTTKNCILIGCSGIGKTQITTWLQEQIEDTEILCVGMGLEHKQESMLFSWVRIFHAFMDQITTNESLLAQLENCNSDSKETENSKDSVERSDPSTNSVGFDSYMPPKDKYASEVAVRQLRPWSGRSDPTSRNFGAFASPAKPSAEIRLHSDNNSINSEGSSNASNRAKSVSYNPRQVSKDHVRYGTLQPEKTDMQSLVVPAMPIPILKESNRSGFVADPFSDTDIPLSLLKCPTDSPKKSHTSVRSRGPPPSQTTSLHITNRAANGDISEEENNGRSNKDEADSGERTAYLEYSTKEPLKDKEQPSIPVPRKRIRPSSAGYVRQGHNNTKQNGLQNSPLSHSGKSLHLSNSGSNKSSKDNLGALTPRAKASDSLSRFTAPWLAVSTRNSYSVFKTPGKRDNTLNSPFSVTSESTESLNPNISNYDHGSERGNKNKRNSAGKYSTLGLGLLTLNLTSNSPTNLHDRISMSIASEASTNNKDKLPKLLKILGILNMPLSTIETLTPVTGFSTGQSSANGVGPVALVLADIFNAFCDIGLRICIILDDIQWCDSYSLELTKSLLAKCPKVLFVMTARPADEWRPMSVGTFNQMLEEDLIKINVSPLTATGVEHMLQVRLLADFDFMTISPDIVEELLNRGQGNPMVTSVLISTLVEDKLLCVKNYTVTRVGGKELLLGMGSTGAVVAQFDKLSAPMKFILRVFSISGQYFKLNEICATLTVLLSKGQDSGILPTVPSIQKLILEQDKYKFIKLTDDENEMCFAHYLIQQAIISSMVPADREAIRRAFMTFYEGWLVTTTDGRLKASIRQNLLFHLIKVPGEEDKKKYHVYEAFLECGEMNQCVEALEYYNMASTLNHHYEPAETCLKKVRECRILARMHLEKCDYEKALGVARQSLTVLGCKNSFIYPTVMNMVPNIFSMAMKVERIIRIESDVKMKEAAVTLLRDVFPNAEISSPNNLKLKYAAPLSDSEQDKLFKEIITIIWVMATCYEQTKPGLELFLLPLMMTAPSLLAIESRNYRMCFYFCALSTMARIFGFSKLSLMSQEIAEKLFRTISTDDKEETMSLYDLFMYSNIHSLLAKQRSLDTDACSAAQYYRRAFLLTVEQGLGSSEDAYSLCQACRVNLQSVGNDEEILEQWFDHGDAKYYDKSIRPFFLAESKSFIAASLVCLNNIERANIFYAEATKHYNAQKDYTDSLRIVHFHMNLLRVSICNHIAQTPSSNQSSVHSNLSAIEESMKKIKQRVFGFPTWVQFCLIVAELALFNIQRCSFTSSGAAKQSNQSEIQESVIRILKFVKGQFVHPKLACWPYLQHIAQALLSLWQSGKCDGFVTYAQKAIQFVETRDVNLSDMQKTMLKSRMFQAKGIIIGKKKSRNAKEINQWKGEGETLKMEFLQSRLRFDWELYLIDKALSC
ncbi:hypothetical protein BDR26DRAFT_322106 [Obelidium mucronatum]|nr:hypothetical protein BDR26DRAFT_322106 [Obelidium mucronatum]